MPPSTNGRMSQVVWRNKIVYWTMFDGMYCTWYLIVVYNSILHVVSALKYACLVADQIGSDRNWAGIYEQLSNRCASEVFILFWELSVCNVSSLTECNRLCSTARRPREILQVYQVDNGQWLEYSYNPLSHCAVLTGRPSCRFTWARFQCARPISRSTETLSWVTLWVRTSCCHVPRVDVKTARVEGFCRNTWSVPCWY